MTKRWSVNAWHPAVTRDYGSFRVAHVSIDWVAPGKGWESGHMTMTVCLLGFGLSVTRWTQPDVYGDGGEA